jgi:catechol 2,3-dioxygenase-like lactoylglutathione lyase family enzyme
MARMSTRRKSNPRKKAKKSPLGKRKEALRPAKKIAAPRRAEESGGAKLTFNHAMVYAADVRRALGFYRDLLGFKLVDEFRHEGVPVYARLRAPGGDGTIALHLAGPGTPLASDGVRLYFEIREVDDFCRKLRDKGLLHNADAAHDAMGLASRLFERSRWPRDQHLLGRREPHEEDRHARGKGN